MGSYLFTWSRPAKEVYVTGDFDDWSRSAQLDKVGDRFEKTVPLPKTNEKVDYKFVVDGEWMTDSSAPEETDPSGNKNNYLLPKDIKPADASATMMSSAGAGSSTAALAGQVPKESKEPKEGAKDATISGVSADSTTTALAGQVPKESSKDTSKDATISSVGAGSTTADLAGQVPKETSKGTSKDATISSVGANSTTADLAGQVPKEGSSDLPGAFPETPAAQEFSAKPFPASEGLGNPIHLKPGEAIPEHSAVTSNTVQSTVGSDSAAGSTSAQPKSGDLSGETSKKPNVIPESGLAMGAGAGAGSATAADALSAARDGPTISSVGANSTTAQLAGQVPKEPKGVPEVVEKSQQAAHTSPEASANPTAVGEKNETEQELTSKVPEDPAASDGSVGGKVAGMATGAAAAATAAVSGAAAYFGTGKGKEDGSADSADKAMPIASTVPDAVQESISDAHQSPEAAASKTAVKEKSEVESELLKSVKKEDMAGEPAPTASAATAETAPKASMKSTEAPLSGATGTSKSTEKPLGEKGTEKPLGEKGTEKPLGEKGTEKPLGEKGTEKPLGEKGTQKPLGEKGTEKPLDTSAATASTAKGPSDGKAAASSTPAAATSTPAKDTPAPTADASNAAAANKTPEQLKVRHDSRDVSPMSKPTGESSGAAASSPTATADSKGKRSSGWFRRMKDKFEHRKHKDKDASA